MFAPVEEMAHVTGSDPMPNGGAIRTRNRGQDHVDAVVLDSSLASTASLSRVQLFLWHEIPEWQQEGNLYIRSGYRKANSSVRHCLHSWTYLHNETANIFSHIIGAIVFFSIPVFVFNAEIPPRYHVATVADKIVCCIYFLGVAVCFVFSATFHTFMCHSAKAFSLGMKLDFQGIILLMWGANIPLIYYGFICSLKLRIVYWTLTSAFALACSIFTFQPKFSEPHLRPLRAATFGSLALSTFIPVIHGLIAYGYAVQNQRMALQWVLATLVFNTLGATAYAFKFPEKWFPQRFDIFGASHQIMHIMVLVAGIMYTFGVLAEFDFLHNNPSTC